jgi:cleavage and polyadenylation specificity factor subunit 4
VSTSSPLRPPGAGGISSSFQHASTLAARPPQLSASFADNSLQRNIWARSETPDEPLSPPASRRPLVAGASARVIPDVFDEHDDHGEDLLPSSLSDLLTPSERARRMSRNDSRDGQSGSPGRLGYNPHQYVGAERLAQSAGAALPPGGFLQSLWSQDGKDAREAEGDSESAELSFGGAQPAQPQARTSLLSQQRNPSGSPSPKSSPSKPATAWKGPSVDAPYLMRGTDPGSPSARALSEHAPGQSLPGGIAAALSRMHMQPGGRTPSGLGTSTPASAAAPTPKRDDHDEEALFHMDG